MLKKQWPPCANKKEVIRNENPDKVISIVKKNCKGLKILTSKQMLQRLWISPVKVRALEQVTYTSQNLNEMDQIMNLSKKVQNNLVNLI